MALAVRDDEAIVKKFINPQLAPSKDETGALRAIGVFGATSRRIVATLVSLPPDALAALPVYAHTSVDVGGQIVMVIRSPELELEGYELFVPSDGFSVIWQKLLGLGATPAGLGAWEIARVEAGRPAWGNDIDETTLPQEANFDDARRNLVHQRLLHRTGNRRASPLPRSREPTPSRPHGRQVGTGAPARRCSRPTASRWARCGPVRSPRASPPVRPEAGMPEAFRWWKEHRARRRTLA